MIAHDLSEKYFDMNKKQCRDALDLYKKFLIRMDRVGEFLKVAEVSCTNALNKDSAIKLNYLNPILLLSQNVGIDKGDIPDLTKVSALRIIHYPVTICYR